MRIITRVLLLLLLAAHGRPAEGQMAGKRVIVYTTAESTSFRLTPADTSVFKPSEPTSEAKLYVFVDPRKTFQSFLGVGGALTDAAAETFAKLPAARQDELITAYYSSDRGIGYTLGRTNINSCDFSSESYTYVTEGDTDLDRKSTRLNSSHGYISYAVFCLKKKKDPARVYVVRDVDLVTPGPTP